MRTLLKLYSILSNISTKTQATNHTSRFGRIWPVGGRLLISVHQLQNLNKLLEQNYFEQKIITIGHHPECLSLHDWIDSLKSNGRRVWKP